MKFCITFLFLILAQINLFAQGNVVSAAKNQHQVVDFFFAGLKDKLAENYVSAAVNFNKVTALDATNDAAYFELANINYRQNKLLDAEIAIKNAINLNNTNIWYIKLEAEIYKKNGNMNALVVVLNQLIEMTPEDVNLYFDKGQALVIAGKKEEAQKFYTILEQKFGKSKELTLAKRNILVQNNANESDLLAMNEIITDDPDEVKNYLFLSGLLLEKNKYEEASALLNKAKTMAPNNFEVDLALADVYKAENKNELAVAQLKLAFKNEAMPIDVKIGIINKMLPRFKNQTVVNDATTLAVIAMEAHPNNSSLLLCYGDVLYQQGNFNGAKLQYLQVLKSTPQIYIAWEKLLGIQTLMGQYKEAIKTGEEALTLFPNQSIIYYYLAFALHRNGQNGEAALEIKSALMLDSDDKNLKAMIFALQAEVLIDQQKFKEANLAFDKAIELTPENYLTLSNYAYYLALRNYDLSKAEMLASKAVKALPLNASVADTYALVLFKLEKYDDALNYIEKAISNNEALNPVYLEHYGDILFLKGNVLNAILQWQKAKIAGNNSEKLNQKINEKKYIK